MKAFFRTPLYHIGFLLFINGLLLSSIFHFKTEGIYEDALFEEIVDKIKADTDPTHSVDSFFVAAMRMTHTLEFSRQQVFGGKRLHGLKASFFRPATIDLMTGDGACGSYSTVLARLLKSGGYHVRIAHMTVNGVEGGHMVVEAKKRSTWIVMDPLFQQYFKKPDGGLASFKDVQANWTYYQQQTNSNYLPAYQYQDVRYTNWDKFPLVGSTIKRVLELSIGKDRTAEIAVRSYILRKYQFLYLLSVGGFIISLLLLVYSIYNYRTSNNKLTKKLS